MGAYHSTCRPETVGLRAIFIAPTETLIFLHFTIHRGTLPQSRPMGVTAPSEREPGWGVYSGAAVDVFVVPVGVEEAVA